MATFINHIHRNILLVLFGSMLLGGSVAAHPTTQTGSVCCTTLEEWITEKSHVELPAYTLQITLGLATALILTLLIILLLRWQVRARTAQLNRKTKALEQALNSLQDAQKQAREQERLYTLGQMASGIAHDFSNILTPIIGFSEALIHHPEQMDDKPALRRYLESIYKAGQDGAEIVSRMKRFYRTYEPEESAPVDPCRAVNDVKEFARPIWKRNDNIKIKTQLEPGLLILIREPELREAILNLLFNALDAMPNGGTVKLSVTRHEGQVTIEVADSGQGMPTDVLENCLTAFYTTKGQDGTGMGLPMVHSICERYGAGMHIQSEPSKGTAIQMVFPLYKPGDESA